MSEKKNGAYGALEKYIMNPLGKLSQTKFVRAIMATGMASIPFTIVGSLFLVFNILPLAIPQLEGFFNATFFRFDDLYMIANVATMGMLAIYFSFVLGFEYTRVIAEDTGLDLAPISGALLSIFAFFMTIPQVVWGPEGMTRVQEVSDNATIINGWAMGDGVTRFGTVGIFAAIIMAVLSTQLYRFCVEKKLVIKMPEAVPMGVARSFTALVPTFVVAFVVLLINGILVFFGTDLFQVIQIPFGFVTQITDSYLGLLVIVFLIHALWSVGIHGATIVTSLIAPITLSNMAENAAGANIPLAAEFWNAFAYPGGSGATLGLTLFMAFMARSEQLKVIGKASIVPGIFNINEPIIFGVPIIYNPDMFIPFILAPMAGASIGYWAIRLEFVRPLIAQQPWPTPLGIGAFIGTGGDWRAIIVALLSVGVAFLVYLPFVRRYDKKLHDQELANAAMLQGVEVSDDDFFTL